MARSPAHSVPSDRFEFPHTQADSVLKDFEATTDPTVLANERARKMYRHMTGKGGAEDKEPPEEAAEEEEAERARPIDGEDCPICYEQMASAAAGGEPTTFCAKCRNSMHQVRDSGPPNHLLHQYAYQV